MGWLFWEYLWPLVYPQPEKPYPLILKNKKRPYGRFLGGEPPGRRKQYITHHFDNSKWKKSIPPNEGLLFYA